MAWGFDNRTCALRVVGHGAGLRFENRLPGGDVNPYLAVAAMIAAGLHGIEHELPLEPALEGNAYDSDAPHVPPPCARPRRVRRPPRSPAQRSGDDVVDHYAEHRRVELAAFDAAVTDWELVRSFERM